MIISRKNSVIEKITELRQMIPKQKITRSAEVFEIFSFLCEAQYEEFWVMLLNKANLIIDIQKISEGGVSGTVVDPKKVFHFALVKLASSMILVHNHPSGNLSPSDADIVLTKKISDAGKLLDISILDHLIIADGYHSFADNGHI
jgi:DNA repair protein RadC